jgi:DNA-directed RNA polymerase subunit RPC12/RpoP
MKPVMIEGGAATLSAVDLIECPRCAARLTFGEASVPLIDSCGFESYSLKCEQCGAELVGIIDPFDDRLLISQSER